MGTVKTFIGNIKGKPGNTPYVGDNGNWWIGELDTGVKAEGEDGKSAYEYAKDGGFTGTEEEFASKLNETAMDAYTKAEADVRFLSTEGGTVAGDVAANSFALNGTTTPYATLKLESPYVVMEASNGRTIIVRPYANSNYGVAFSSSYVYPETTEKLSLGKASRMFKDLYLAGKITDGTNNVTPADLAGHLSSTENPHGVTAAQVGADAVGSAASALNDAKSYANSSISAHNTNTAAHSDLRLELQALADRVNAALNSTDTDLDQMAEIVAYIKSNKSLIDAITTSKVSVSDIINNLTSNVTNKPLSAAQGVALNSLIDTLTSTVNSKAAATDLTAHTGNKSNPHGVTAAQVGAVPTSRTVNGKALSENISLSAVDIGLKTESWTFTLEDGSTVTKAVYVG